MNEKRVVIYPNKLKIFGLIIGGVLLIFGGIFIKSCPELVKWLFNIFLNPRLSNLATGVVTFMAFYIGMPFFGFGVVYLLYRLMSPKPSLTIDERGVCKNASLINVGIIYWEEIKNVFIHSVVGQKFLRLELANPEGILKRINCFKRFIMKMNLFLTKPYIDIPQNIVSRNLEEILKIIETYRIQGK